MTMSAEGIKRALAALDTVEARMVAAASDALPPLVAQWVAELLPSSVLKAAKSAVQPLLAAAEQQLAEAKALRAEAEQLAARACEQGNERREALERDAADYRKMLTEALTSQMHDLREGFEKCCAAERKKLAESYRAHGRSIRQEVESLLSAERPDTAQILAISDRQSAQSEALQKLDSAVQALCNAPGPPIAATRREVVAGEGQGYVRPADLRHLIDCSASRLRAAANPPTDEASQ